ncbi:hypothetical protein DPMN_127905 [Dreissena polymorpha]|uniref:Uncharacterized protein n=1 Tax=Dreissena polymorpha TaxID=45954 RepID=A0A9D4H2U8_DREPO|nr:hypothetical protein DPMN_127905 [Dreissena polymorpha]
MLSEKDSFNCHVYLLVGKQHRKQLLVGCVQLVEDGLAPAEKSLLAAFTLQLLCHTVIIASEPQDLADMFIWTSGHHLLTTAWAFKARPPETTRHPAQEGVAKVPVNIWQASVDTCRLWWVVPQLADIHLNPALGIVRDNCLGDPRVVHGGKVPLPVAREWTGVYFLIS